jgi:hypothetical protein
MALSKLKPNSFDDTVEGNPSLIINGDMAVSQRGTSFTTPSAYTIDRVYVGHTATDQLVTTVSQSSTAPSSFSNSLRINVTTAETALAADEVVFFELPIEAQNLQHLNYGASSAKSLTLSFWVRSSLTGKYSVLFYEHDATRSNLQSFNISTADTWEYKTITIDGDTSGTINDDNGKGLSLYFTLAAGTDWTGTPHTGWGAYVQTDDFAFSDNVDFSAQTGNFYITGIKLEVGSVATSFKHETYADNLRKCQRYYEELNTDNVAQYIAGGWQYSDAGFWNWIVKYTPKRATPTLVGNWTDGNLFYCYADGAGVAVTSFTTNGASTAQTVIHSSGTDRGDGGISGGLYCNSASARMAFNAEL